MRKHLCFSPQPFSLPGSWGVSHSCKAISRQFGFSPHPHLANHTGLQGSSYSGCKSQRHKSCPGSKPSLHQQSCTPATHSHATRTSLLPQGCRKDEAVPILCQAGGSQQLRIKYGLVAKRNQLTRKPRQLSSRKRRPWVPKPLRNGEDLGGLPSVGPTRS